MMNGQTIAGAMQDFRGAAAEIVDRLLVSAGLHTPFEQQIAIAVGLACLALLGVFFLLLTKRVRTTRCDPDARLPDVTRRPRWLGYAALAIFVAAFTGWSVVVPLASAALAPGVVSPDGNRKTVQHLEGGIIHSILVREGDVVAAGQALVILDDTQARARLNQLQAQLSHHLATEARLMAEQTGADEIAFPPALRTASNDAATLAMRDQRHLFLSRRATAEGRGRILGQRIKQLQAEIKGIKQVIAAQQRQHALIDREIVGVQKLFDKGLGRLERLLALQRGKADIQASIATSRAQIARNKQQIGETELQILSLREQERERVNEELTNLRTALAELRSQIAARRDVFARTTINAPISGTVMQLRITTESGVVGAGEAILDIVPDKAGMIIDARVKPTDIEHIHPGMRANVLLTAYRQRNLPKIHGVLRSISADRLVEDRSGEAYFLAKVEIDPTELAKLEDVRLIPGMPADVMLLNRERSLWDYIFEPIVLSLDKGFREG